MPSREWREPPGEERERIGEEGLGEEEEIDGEGRAASLRRSRRPLGRVCIAVGSVDSGKAMIWEALYFGKSCLARNCSSSS